MWSCVTQSQPDSRTRKLSPRKNGLPVSYSNVLRAWQHDEAFRTFFISLLAESNSSCFRWETPAISRITADRDFEFVLIDAPGLDVNPDIQTFAEYFPSPGSRESVVTFPNLGKDAILVVPCPVGPPSAYGHLAAFIRSAPEAQKHDLWRSVGIAMEARLGSNPIWLSTAGMGVSWLHVRLDSRPKYYGFAPYRRAE